MSNSDLSCSMANIVNAPIDKIIVNNRLREARRTDHITESIKKVGLLNPIVIDQNYKLVAGLHRLTACKSLGWDKIPARIVPFNNENEARLAEIDENLAREDLTELEQGVWLAERKRVYEALYPESKNGAKNRSNNYGADLEKEIISFSKDTANKTGQTSRTISNKVRIGESLSDFFDDLKDTPIADTQKDLLALAAIAKKDKAAAKDIVTRLKTGEAGTVGKAKALLRNRLEGESNRAVVANKVDLIQSDAIRYLLDLENASVDLLITDPPYKTDVDDIGAFAAAWLPIALSKIKSTGRAYIFTGSYPEELLAYLSILNSQDNFIFNDVLVWAYKNTIGPSPSHSYKRNWQACFYLYGKDAPPLNCDKLVEQFSAQVINAPDARTGARYHAWQKPDELAKMLINHSTKPGDLVVDCFAGTGTFLIQAAKLGRTAKGCEVDEKMLALCAERGIQTINARAA